MNATLSTSGRAVVTGPVARCQPRRSTALRVVANAAGSSSSGREEALRQMHQFKSSLSAQLTHHETELKKGIVATSSAAGASVTTSAEAALMEELDASGYYSKTEGSDGLVVVKWTGKTCGPCKIMEPKVEAMAREFAAVQFFKIFVNASNKEVGTAAGIRAAPTFQLFKGGQKVAEVVGAKEAELRAAIEEHA